MLSHPIKEQQAFIRAKGKHASSTENRSYFTLKEYHAKRDSFCRITGVSPSKVAGGFVSLLVKGIIVRDKNIYSIHYRLIPYMRKKAELEYGLVTREIYTKR